MVEKFGAVPPKAEKSKRVTGEMYEVTASYGTTTSVDTAGAEQLLLTMIEAGMDRKTAAAIHEQLFVFQPKVRAGRDSAEGHRRKLPKARRAICALSSIKQ
jgi:hypothetical protein